MPHLNYYMDFVVDVFIVCRNKVLLRMHDKYKQWFAVGGHIDPGEDPNQAAIREVKEEVGLDVTLHGSIPPPSHEKYTELIAPAFMNRHHITATHEHMSLVFFAVAETEELHIDEGAEKAECRWFTREELNDDRIMPHIQHYAKTALETLAE